MTRYESLLDDFELVVGDSSEIYMIYSPDINGFDTDWSAHMAIVEDLEDTTPLIIRPLGLNEELIENGEVIEEANKYFVVQITPAESSLLQPDEKYYFVVQLKNDVLGYKQELIQCKIKTKKQGIFR